MKKSNSDDGDTCDVNNDVESDDLDNHHDLIRILAMTIFTSKSDDNDEDIFFDITIPFSL